MANVPPPKNRRKHYPIPLVPVAYCTRRHEPVNDAACLDCFLRHEQLRAVFGLRMNCVDRHWV